MRRLRGSLVGLCALGALALSACGNGVPAASGAGGGGGGSADGTAGVNLGPPDVKVLGTDQLQFSPVSQTASVGQIVQWSNPGTVAHTITFDTEPSLSDSQITPGGTWEVKFKKAGTYTYKCTIHPGMNGTLTIH